MTSPKPYDPARCQVVITPAYSARDAFQIGNPRRPPARCENAPTHLLRETTPGPDGQLGSMSVCARCLNEYMKKPQPSIEVVPLSRTER